MKKIFYIILVCVGLWFIYDSCSGSEGNRNDGRTSYSSSSEEYEENSSSSGKFADTELYNQTSLMGLLSGKTFKGQANGTMTFSGNGGTIEGYPFTIYSMEVINPKLGKISISVPSMQMDGTFTVIIGDDAIVLADRETGNTFEYR